MDGKAAGSQALFAVVILLADDTSEDVPTNSPLAQTGTYKNVYRRVPGFSRCVMFSWLQPSVYLATGTPDEMHHTSSCQQTLPSTSSWSSVSYDVLRRAAVFSHKDGVVFGRWAVIRSS